MRELSLDEVCFGLKEGRTYCLVDGSLEVVFVGAFIQYHTGFNSSIVYARFSVGRECLLYSNVTGAVSEALTDQGWRFTTED
jgi:hypothetical protein